MIASVLALFSQFSTGAMAQRERTFIMVKPDGVHRGLVGEIIKRFEQRGYKLVAMKYMQVGSFLFSNPHGTFRPAKWWLRLSKKHTPRGLSKHVY